MSFPQCDLNEEHFWWDSSCLKDNIRSEIMLLMVVDGGAMPLNSCTGFPKMNAGFKLLSFGLESSFHSLLAS